MDKFLGTFDPNQVTLTLGTLKVSGYFDGTFITVAKLDNELYKNHVGAYGEMSRTKNNNNAGTITFTLKRTSPANQQLDLLKRNPATFAASVKDGSSSKFTAVSSDCWIMTDPDDEFSVEESAIEWVVMCSDLNKSFI